MNGRYLLDTNIIIAILADESQAKESLAQAEQVFLPKPRVERGSLGWHRLWVAGLVCGSDPARAAGQGLAYLSFKQGIDDGRQQDHVAKGRDSMGFLQAERPTQAGLLMKRMACSAVCWPV